MADEHGMTVRFWVELIRRARLGRTVKAVAFALAHYADPDGTRVFPGVARLSVECELSYNVVQASLSTLRRAELIEVVKPAQRRKYADEYRLIIGPNVMERVEILSPNERDAAVAKVQDEHRGKHIPSPHPKKLHPMGSGAAEIPEPVDNDGLHPTARGAGEEPEDPAAPHGVGPDPQAAPHGALDLHPTPLATTSHGPATRDDPLTGEDLRTAVTDSRARDQEEDHDLSQVCEHGLALARRFGGLPECPACKRRNLPDEMVEAVSA